MHRRGRRISLDVKGDRLAQISVDSQNIFVFTDDTDNHTLPQGQCKLEPEWQTTLLFMLSMSSLKVLSSASGSVMVRSP